MASGSPAEPRGAAPLARQRSQALRRTSRERLADTRRILGECLSVSTRILDSTDWPGERPAHVDRLSLIVGRDPSIEQAKAELAARYGVTRAEAFGMMLDASQRRNMKVRDVARELLVAGEPPA